MKILKVNPQDLRESENVIIQAVEAIKNGQVIICPTDTVYGLAVDATNQAAVERLFQIKKRPKEKAVPIMIGDMVWAKRLALIDQKTEKILSEIWPGAVTAVLQQKYRLPELVTAGKRTIALRIPDYKLIHYLLQKIGRPLTATSANLSGQLPSIRIQDVLRQFQKKEYRPDLVLDAGDLIDSEPSTILDLSGASPKILRLGPVSKEKLWTILYFSK